MRRGDFQTYDRLYKAWGHLVPVKWDRRRAHNRPRAHADTAPSASKPNRRRKPPISWTAFGFDIVVDRSAEWIRAAVSACEADYCYIAAQASAPLVRGPLLEGRHGRQAARGAQTHRNVRPARVVNGISSR